MRSGLVAQSFVARIWLERGSNGEPVWRGHVRHIQSSEQSYFQELGVMCDFIGQVSGEPCRPFSKAPNNDAVAS